MRLEFTVYGKKILAVVLTFIFIYSFAGEAADLPDPDGKPADMSKPVQVFILMGQSNMLGFGKLSGLKKATENGLYPYLVDDAGNWTTRKDVRNVRRCNYKQCLNDWMSPSTGIGKGRQIGPEIGIGYYVGELIDAPVLILKVCIGNRSLGWDLLPPSSEKYQGNRDVKPRQPKPRNGKEWYGGIQYDTDVHSAHQVLGDLGTHNPGATKYEIGGFFFWQGAKDLGRGGDHANYEKNLVALIKDLRKDFNAPNAPFVCATMANIKKDAGGPAGNITKAQLAVDGSTGKYPEFKGNVATFYAFPTYKGRGGANGHYGGNAETYMNVGVGMGQEMVELLKAKVGSKKANSTAAPTRTQAAMLRRTRPSIMSKANREIESMLNYMKMIQPRIKIGEKVYPGLKVHNYLVNQYQAKKAEMTTTERFLNEIAYKSRKDNVLYVVNKDGSQTMLKTWLKDYLAKLKKNR